MCYIELQNLGKLNQENLWISIVRAIKKNTAYFYPDEKNKERAIRMVEKDFLNYIRTDFLSSEGNAYWVLEKNNIWVCALRLYQINEELFYIEALETHPEYRKHGYASMLINEMVSQLKKLGNFKIYDCVNKKNTASIRTHIKSGFQIISDEGFNYLNNESDDRDYGMQLIV